ncbi:MAG: hypothetical protein KDA41_13935, partial [Planctomycetales bacterium]|nr:hypothetical protein [Planctomycetales bacterium]
MNTAQRLGVLFFFAAAGVGVAAWLVQTLPQQQPSSADADVERELAAAVAPVQPAPPQQEAIHETSPQALRWPDVVRVVRNEPYRVVQGLRSPPLPTVDPKFRRDPFAGWEFPQPDRLAPPAEATPLPSAPVATPSVAMPSLVQPATATSPIVAAPGQPEEAAVARPVVYAEALRDEGDGRLTINIPGTEIREVLDLLSRAGDLNILASNSVQGSVKASLTGVDVDTALAAILKSTGYVSRREGRFVYVGTAEDFQAMDHAIDRVGTRVYRPNYVSAAELQTLITPMLSSGVGSVSVSSAPDVGIASDPDSSGGDKFAGAEVVLVRDYEAVLAQIDQVYDEVDRRPLQVSIEAMILSVKLSDDVSVGVDWEVLRNKNHIRFAFGSPLTSITQLNNLDLTNNSGLKFGFLDTSLGAFVDALEKVGETHVISSPRLMCLNKQRAEIHIGEERGYISTTVTETASTQSVEFLEVGTQLRLRPFISNDGLIRMEVHPELSTGNVAVSDNFTLPNKTVTQVTTNVMIRDGATLVIGGLLREDLERNATQLPVLGSLPWIGPAFRRQDDKTNRDEIIVLITPRIVWEPRFNCEGEYADCEFHQTHAIFADKMSHISRVHYGRNYRRLAKAAWAAGDAHKALK